jgi:hypothetical protein
MNGSVAGRQGGGREINECYSKTEKPVLGNVPGNQRRVTLSQKLEQPIK